METRFFRFWGAVLRAMAGDGLPTIMEPALWKKLVAAWWNMRLVEVANPAPWATPWLNR